MHFRCCYHLWLVWAHRIQLAIFYGHRPASTFDPVAVDSNVAGCIGLSAVFSFAWWWLVFRTVDFALGAFLFPRSDALHLTWVKMNRPHRRQKPRHMESICLTCMWSACGGDICVTLDKALCLILMKPVKLKKCEGFVWTSRDSAADAVGAPRSDGMKGLGPHHAHVTMETVSLGEKPREGRVQEIGTSLLFQPSPLSARPKSPTTTSEKQTRSRFMTSERQTRNRFTPAHSHCSVFVGVQCHPQSLAAHRLCRDHSTSLSMLEPIRTLPSSGYDSVRASFVSGLHMALTNMVL
ncbi:hypothetical protein K438DRAFT_1776586 [Mycena galopus ATCC 62051]|nr:hypothetical protein K438DRAFT_1776586 [Mycena galopus ATCC 62051]